MPIDTNDLNNCKTFSKDMPIGLAVEHSVILIILPGFFLSIDAILRHRDFEPKRTSLDGAKVLYPATALWFTSALVLAYAATRGDLSYDALLAAAKHFELASTVILSLGSLNSFGVLAAAADTPSAFRYAGKKLLASRPVKAVRHAVNRLASTPQAQALENAARRTIKTAGDGAQLVKTVPHRAREKIGEVARRPLSSLVS